MKAKTLALIASLTLAGCASNNTKSGPDWHDYVAPMQNGTNSTEVFTNDQGNGKAYALRFARQACESEEKRLEVINIDQDFVGISDSEKATTKAINTASSALFFNTGYWLGQKNTPADWKTTMVFSCQK